MKVLMVFCLVFCLVRLGSAQDTSFTSINDDSELIAEENATRQKLVELALKNSDKKISDYQVDVAKQQVGIAKAQWLSTIFASSYWNEFSINPSAKDQLNFYYPKYNFGINVPLSIFITVPKAVKVAKTQLHVATEESKLKALAIKNAVLSKYEDYLMYKKQLTIENIVTNNEHNALLEVERNFRSGTASVAEYNKQMQSYNAELSRKISLQHDLAVARLGIEQIIGISLDAVVR